MRKETFPGPFIFKRILLIKKNTLSFKNMPYYEKRVGSLTFFFVKRILYLQKNVYSDIFRVNMQNVRNFSCNV